MSIVMPTVESDNAVNGTVVNGNHVNNRINGVAGLVHAGLAPVEIVRDWIAVPPGFKNSWATGKLTRKLGKATSELRFQSSSVLPEVGDCVLVKITKVANHSRMFTDDNQYSRVYQNDHIIGVLGTRYATDAYHATKIDVANLHMLTNGGLLGTVCDSHNSMKNPTKVELVGYLCDDGGVRINFKEVLFRRAQQFPADIHPVFTVGTGMNSGKTTSTARLGQALASQGLRVAILKLTGSASHRDIHEFNATGAAFAADFSDYGFPSTYLTTLAELEGLYGRMLNDAAAVSPDVVLIEIADGVYQRETEALLNSSVIRSSTSGVVLTAACAASAIAIDQSVKRMGWDPIAVTGLITNAPLFVQEFSDRSETPVCDTGKGILETCRLIMSRVRSRKLAAVSTSA